MKKEVYISKDAAIINLQWANSNVCGGFMDLNGAIDAIEYTREADVAPVRHGKWILGKEMACCSVCSFKTPKSIPYLDTGVKWVPFYATKYCGNCGAKMESEL